MDSVMKQILFPRQEVIEQILTHGLHEKEYLGSQSDSVLNHLHEGLRSNRERKL